MSKKNIAIISSLVIIGIAVLVGTGLYIYHYVQPLQETASPRYDPTKPSTSLSGDATKQEEQTTPDLSQDFGACAVTNVPQINDVLGIATTQAANNRGIAHIRGGTAQSCTYVLSSEDTGTKRLTVTITRYDTSESKNQAVDGYKEFTKVSDVSDTTYFVSSKNEPTNVDDPTVPSNLYSLTVFSNQQSVELQLTIPTSTNTFSDNSAQEALTALAKQATLPN